MKFCVLYTDFHLHSGANKMTEFLTILTWSCDQNPAEYLWDVTEMRDRKHEYEADKSAEMSDESCQRGAESHR